MSAAAMTIQDRHPPACQGDKKPGPGPAETALGRAALAFAAADKAVRDHHGPRAGEDYDAKVSTWRKTYQALLQSADAYKPREGEGTDAGNQD